MKMERAFNSSQQAGPAFHWRRRFGANPVCTVHLYLEMPAGCLEPSEEEMRRVESELLAKFKEDVAGLEPCAGT